MNEIAIWHNPRCSKSRKTLQIIRDRGLEPEIVRYLEEAPSVEQIDRVLGLLRMEPRDLLRRNEKAYRDLGLADVEGRAALVRAMHENPILIERPVVIRGDRAVLGRPPESVETLLP